MFRLLNVAGRAALEHDGHWHDLAAATGDATLADPMAAVARHAELHAVQATLAGRCCRTSQIASSLDPVQ